MPSVPPSDSPEIYTSNIAWDPSRPPALVICCVDGRWFAQMEEFARERLGTGSRTDFLCVPGGIEPLTLMDMVPKDFNFVRRRMEALVAAHGTKRIIAIAHQDCAWYKQHKIGSFKLDLRERQLTDLRCAARHLKDLFPGSSVETYFARLTQSEPRRVVFDVV